MTKSTPTHARPSPAYIALLILPLCLAAGCHRGHSLSQFELSTLEDSTAGDEGRAPDRVIRNHRGETVEISRDAEVVIHLRDTRVVEADLRSIAVEDGRVRGVAESGGAIDIALEDVDHVTTRETNQGGIAIAVGSVFVGVGLMALALAAASSSNSGGGVVVLGGL